MLVVCPAETLSSFTLKRCRTTQGPKGKVAQAFQEDEEAEAKVEFDFNRCQPHCIGAKERESEMKRKLAVTTSMMKDTASVSISSSTTPVMASIMKEETENRELVSHGFPRSLMHEI